MSLWSRIANVLRGDRLSRDIDEELSAHIEDAIEQGRQPIEETSRALAACWQELVERSGTTSISVTNTGQKIIARRMNEEAVRERTT